MFERRLFLAAALAVAACAHGRPAQHAERPRARFDYVGQDWMRFDAKAGSVSTRLILDTGGGVTLLSKQLCEKIGCTPDGTFTGKRMSGQAITLPMMRVSSIVIAGHEVKNARVAVLDTASLLHPDLGVDGLAGLDLFRDQPITVEYGTRELVLEDERSLEKRRSAGQPVAVRVKHDGPSTEVYLPLTLTPDAPALEMEVDSGSRDLILDERFMSVLGIDPAGPNVKRVEGKDETDHEYVRHFTTVPRALSVPGTHEVAIPASSTVMFQKIIHDGLVGHAFLSAYTTTYDLRGATMIFAKR